MRARKQQCRGLIHKISLRQRPQISLHYPLKGSAVPQFCPVNRVGTGCSGYKIFGPPNQSGKIFGRSVEFGWSLVVINKSKLYEKQDKLVDYAVSLSPIFLKTTV